MVKHAYHAKDQRQQIIGIAGGALHALGQVALLAQPGFIKKFNAADPVAVTDSPMSFNIILPAGKIPHKVTEVHMAELVTEKETHVFSESRPDDGFRFPAVIGGRDGNPLYLSPAFISPDVIILRTPHTRKNRGEFRIVVRN
ncbi:hypothetical protein DSECCO2_347730 [anaerobic digester metagenome]